MYLGRGVNSQIHYHPTGSAMLFALHGRWVVRLYAPDQTPHLAKVPDRNVRGEQVSSVGELTNELAAAAYPDFADAEYVDFTVSAGDVLFVPICWWHSIQNLDEVSLTAVHFWSQDWSYTCRHLAPKQLPPPGSGGLGLRAAVRDR
jgi:jumonji domain-containing protein 7